MQDSSKNSSGNIGSDDYLTEYDYQSLNESKKQYSSELKLTKSMLYQCGMSKRSRICRIAGGMSKSDRSTVFSINGETIHSILSIPIINDKKLELARGLVSQLLIAKGCHHVDS